MLGGLLPYSISCSNKDTLKYVAPRRQKFTPFSHSSPDYIVNFSSTKDQPKILVPFPFAILPSSIRLSLSLWLKLAFLLDFITPYGKQ